MRLSKLDASLHEKYKEDYLDTDTKEKEQALALIRLSGLYHYVISWRHRKKDLLDPSRFDNGSVIYFLSVNNES